MTTQKMYRIEMSDFGGAEVLTLAETSFSSLNPGEVRIKVQAAGVNYSDVLRRENRYYLPTSLPFTPGAEVAGVITEKGEGVDLELGTRVLAMLPAGGGYSEYVTALAPYCIPLPPNIPSEVAPALFVQGSTAHLMISQLAGNLKDKTVLVHAAAGGVGSLLVQLAKLGGAKVIATASSEEKLQTAKALGADVLVNYGKADWKTDLLAQTEGEKVDLVFEMVGGQIFRDSFLVLKPFGKMIVYGRVGAEVGTMNSEEVVDAGHIIMGFNLGHHIQFKMEAFQTSLGAMTGMVAEGTVTILQTHTYPLKEAAQAHQDLENRKTTGKIVLIP